MKRVTLLTATRTGRRIYFDPRSLELKTNYALRGLKELRLNKKKKGFYCAAIICNTVNIRPNPPQPQFNRASAHPIL